MPLSSERNKDQLLYDEGLKFKYCSFDKHRDYLCRWASLLYITPLKKFHSPFFLTYQAFKNREGIFSQTNLAV